MKLHLLALAALTAGLVAPPPALSAPRAVKKAAAAAVRPDRTGKAIRLAAASGCTDLGKVPDVPQSATSVKRLGRSKDPNGRIVFNISSGGAAFSCGGPYSGGYHAGVIQGGKFYTYGALAKQLADAGQSSSPKAFEYAQNAVNRQKACNVASGQKGKKICQGVGGTVIKYDDTLFGVNDGSGYNDSYAFNSMVAKEEKKMGLKLARMGADNIGCRSEGQACNFSGRDQAVRAHLEQGIGMHMVLSFRAHVDGGGEDQWLRNYKWFCGQVAKQYKDKVKYFIVDNETDLSYGGGQLGKVEPAKVVKFQKACYEGVKAVDTSALVESSPATSPETPYNDQMLAAGLGNYADVIGTHMYGGQLDRDAISTLKKYMANHGVNKPVACSECGSIPSYFPGQDGSVARAKWLIDFAKMAKRHKMHNVLYFSMWSSHDEWEMDKDANAIRALTDIGHGRF